MTKRANYARFYQIASDIKIEGDAARAYYGQTGNEVLSKFGRRVRNEIAAIFSPLSDMEMSVACSALVQEVFCAGTDITSPNPLRILIDRCVLIRSAEVVSIVTPTFVRIAPPGIPSYGMFSKVLSADRSLTNTPAREWLFRSFSEQRINFLHGRLMHAVALTLSNSPRSAHFEWFGKNRDRVIPLWELLVKDDVFSPERVQVLLENVEHGATGVLGGAL